VVLREFLCITADVLHHRLSRTRTFPHIPTCLGALQSFGSSNHTDRLIHTRIHHQMTGHPHILRIRVFFICLLDVLNQVASLVPILWLRPLLRLGCHGLGFHGLGFHGPVPRTALGFHVVFHQLAHEISDAGHLEH
jgi:hypothetical protein